MGHQGIGMLGAEDLLEASIQRPELRIGCGHQDHLVDG
jgi:hypothetical protein